MKSGKSIVWTHGLTKRLVAEYRRRPVLWDTKHVLYRSALAKHEAWTELAESLGCGAGEVKMKFKSLLASHRRERQRVARGHHSIWFMYDHFSFMPLHVPNTNCQFNAEANSDEEQEKEQSPQASDQELSNNELEDGNGGNEWSGSGHVKEEPVERTLPIRRRPRLRNYVQGTRYIKSQNIQHRSNGGDFRSQLDRKLGEKLLEMTKLSNRSNLRRKDELDSFGEYVADSLRKHDEKTQSLIKQAINNILFEQEMKKYSDQGSIIIPNETDENPLLLEVG